MASRDWVELATSHECEEEVRETSNRRGRAPGVPLAVQPHSSANACFYLVTMENPYMFIGEGTIDTQESSWLSKQPLTTSPHWMLSFALPTVCSVNVRAFLQSFPHIL